MRALNSLRLCAAVLAFACAISCCGAAEMWAGFRPVDQLDLPFRDYADNSVVFTDSAGSHEEGHVTIVDISEVPPAALSELAPVTDATKSQPNLRSITIETCRQQNLRYCPVYDRSSRATAFFDEGVRMIGCRHNLHNWLVSATEANPDRAIETLSPPLIIYSKDFQVLYNSATVPADRMLKFTFLNKDPRIQIMDFGLGSKPARAYENLRLSDVAELTSPVPIVMPQKIKWRIMYSTYERMETVYTVGYPGVTDYFTDGSLDSSGRALVASSGTIRIVDTSVFKVKTSNVGKTGMSGGPVFDETGKVLGVHCWGGNDDAADARLPFHSVFLIYHKPQLEKLWGRLEF